MIFKYPPWILPIFLPFAFLSLSTAKYIWAILQAACLGYVIRWLQKQRIASGLILILLLIFSGIWSVHAYVGQVTLSLLALALGLGPRVLKSERGWRIQVLLWALSVKVITLFPFLGVRWRARDIGVAGLCVILWTVLTFPALATTPGKSLTTLFHSWREASASGGHSIQGLKVETTSREVQGFPVLAVRILGVQDSRSDLFFMFSILSCLIVALGWGWASKGLTTEERWVGWLGWTAAVQPLAWFHFFALGFPLAVFAVDRSLRAKHRVGVILAILGALMIAALTQKTLGSAGLILENLSVKSWGILLCACSLAITAKKGR